MKDSIVDNLRFWGLTILFAILIILATIFLIGSIQNAVLKENIMEINNVVPLYDLFAGNLYSLWQRVVIFGGMIVLFGMIIYTWVKDKGVVKGK